MNNKDEKITYTKEAPITTQTVKIKKKQIELSDDDVTLLNMSQFSDSAWEDIARKHSFDYTTREAIPNTKNRGYLAQHKKWEPKKQVGGALTTKKLGR